MLEEGLHWLLGIPGSAHVLEVDLQVDGCDVAIGLEEMVQHVSCWDVGIAHHVIIQDHFKMKPRSITDPKFYLEDNLKKTVMPDGVVAWGMSSSNYVQAVVQNVQEYLGKNGDRKLKNKASASFWGILQGWDWRDPGVVPRNGKLLPVPNWDDCLIREAYVISSNALEVFSFEGQVPYTIVKGQTSDISPLAEYAWYEWVKFRDTGQSFPHSKE
jgi:hypothetical protein